MIYVECKERKEFVKLTDISLCTVMLDNEGQIELQVKDDKDKLMWRVMMIAEAKLMHKGPVGLPTSRFYIILLQQTYSISIFCDVETMKRMLIII